ncbi:MAG: biopolymer transporter ExbD [Thermoguttaceae bacterium]|nr:biopolymer transporter ExbD [Thermoguttaceae bacterium]MDO4856321.1 biopolymer transporter ExbD [Thermoguttaceae bacterium]
MAVKIQKGNALASLSITPLIDVVFLLLIFFLVATKFDEEESALDIQLPQATESTPIWSQPQSLIINITRNGEYFVSGQNVSAKELRNLLETSWKNPLADSSVVIRGDERAPFGVIVKAANMCQELKLNYSTVTREE